MAGKNPIAPILIADKATVAFSAEEGGKIRCVYPSWENAKVVLDGQHLEVRRSKQGLEFRIVDGRGRG
jgi:hypothetical protein